MSYMEPSTLLNLIFGQYHQVHMSLADGEKTTFRIDNRHFDLLVMPFGLTNAPSTFKN